MIISHNTNSNNKKLQTLAWASRLQDSMRSLSISFRSSFLFCLFIKIFTRLWRVSVSLFEASCISPRLWRVSVSLFKASCISPSIFLCLGFLVFSKRLWILTWKEEELGIFNVNQNSKRNKTEQDEIQKNKKKKKSAPCASHWIDMHNYWYTGQDSFKCNKTATSHN